METWGTVLKVSKREQKGLSPKFPNVNKKDRPSSFQKKG